MMHVLLVICLGLFTGNSNAEITGNWQVKAEVTDLMTNQLYTFHENSYWWSDAALNHSMLAFKKNGEVSFGNKNKPRKATYKLFDGKVVFYFISDEGKTSSWTYNITLERNGFLLTYEDVAYKHLIRFYKN